MKKYCFDTSGLSNPLEMMPEDINFHVSMWTDVKTLLAAGEVAVTAEIYEEMQSIPGSVGDCIRNNKDQLILEVEQGEWDWGSYVGHAARMQVDYEQFISEYNGGRNGTVGLNDISIIALGKTLGLPVVSMENRMQQLGEVRRKIPNICDHESVPHFSFSDFLRAEQR